MAPPAKVTRYARMAEQLQADNEGLHRQLAEAQAREPERVEVPALQPGEVATLEQAIAAVKDATAPLELALDRAAKAAKAPAPSPRPVLAPRAPARPVASPAPSPAADAPAVLSRAQRAILTVLAQFPEGRTKNQVAALSGYSVKSSSFGNALGALRSAGYANRGDPIQATAEGVAALGGDWEPLPEGEALIEHWMSKLGKAERVIWRVLLDAFPAELAKDEVAERSGYSATSSSFGNALGRLRTLELIHGWQADETLAQHAQGSIHA